MDKENTLFNQPATAAMPWNMNHKQHYQPNNYEKESLFRGRSEISTDEDKVKKGTSRKTMVSE